MTTLRYLKMYYIYILYLNLYSLQFKIRRDALLGLGSLYKTITLNEESTQAQLDKISFVTDKVFHAYYNTNAEDK